MHPLNNRPQLYPTAHHSLLRHLRVRFFNSLVSPRSISLMPCIYLIYVFTQYKYIELHNDSNDNLDSTIPAAFLLTAADRWKLSYGDRNDTSPMLDATRDMQIIDPKDEESHDAPRWLASISGTLMQEGWRAAYSDGTSRDDHAAARAHLQGRRCWKQGYEGRNLG